MYYCYPNFKSLAESILKCIIVLTKSMQKQMSEATREQRIYGCTKNLLAGQAGDDGWQWYGSHSQGRFSCGRGKDASLPSSASNNDSRMNSNLHCTVASHLTVETTPNHCTNYVDEIL